MMVVMMMLVRAGGLQVSQCPDDHFAERGVDGLRAGQGQVGALVGVHHIDQLLDQDCCLRADSMRAEDPSRAVLYNHLEKGTLLAQGIAFGRVGIPLDAHQDVVLLQGLRLG